MGKTYKDSNSPRKPRAISVPEYEECVGCGGLVTLQGYCPDCDEMANNLEGLEFLDRDSILGISQ